MLLPQCSNIPVPHYSIGVDVASKEDLKTMNINLKGAFLYGDTSGFNDGIQNFDFEGEGESKGHL
jgi:hypothetical protein